MTGNSGAERAFIVDEVRGAWGAAIAVPGMARLGAETSGDQAAVSCGAPGNCVVGGSYADGGATRAFVARQVRGAWQAATGVPGLAGLRGAGPAGSGFSGISCARGPDCVLAGFYDDGHRAGTQVRYQAFVDRMVNGRWLGPARIPGLAQLGPGADASVGAVSCSSPGDCVIGGQYEEGADGRAFVASLVDGRWHDPIAVPGTAAMPGAAVDAVSCASRGNCAAGGSYVQASGETRGFVASEVNGTWDSAITLPVVAAPRPAGSGVWTVSCQAAGNCSAGGFYASDGDAEWPLIATETGGTWHSAIQVPGTGPAGAAYAGVQSVSCPPAGPCIAGGSYQASHGRSNAFLASGTPSTAAQRHRRGQ